MPQTAAISASPVSSSNGNRPRSAKPAKARVMLRVRSRPWRGRPGDSGASRAGNSRKQVTSATPMPMVIIQPKSITGRMSLITSEEKPTMVVSTM